MRLSPPTVFDEYIRHAIVFLFFFRISMIWEGESGSRFPFENCSFVSSTWFSEHSLRYLSCVTLTRIKQSGKEWQNYSFPKGTANRFPPLKSSKYETNPRTMAWLIYSSKTVRWDSIIANSDPVDDASSPKCVLCGPRIDWPLFSRNCWKGDMLRHPSFLALPSSNRQLFFCVYCR